MKPLAGAGSVAAIEAWLIARVEGSTGIAREEIDISRPFAYFGLSSSSAVSLSGDLEDLLGRPLPATLVWDYPTIECLARHLAGCADAVKTGSGRDPGQPPT